MEHQLTRGCALVLTGPQGCGKTAMARQIAAAHGSYREIEAADLDLPFRLGNALFDDPCTLIVEGAPARIETMNYVKAMLTNGIAVLEEKGIRRLVKAPNFIFCTGDANPLNLGSDERRFRVVKLG